MPAITALLHTHDDALRLGRALETLYPFDNIVVIDHGSRDETADLAREYGARVLTAKSKVAASEHLQFVSTGWVFCLDPRESLSEALAASLFEWKSEAVSTADRAFAVFLREETADGWIENPTAQTRLVPSNWSRWEGCFPTRDASAIALEGELLRFVFP